MIHKVIGVGSSSNRSLRKILTDRLIFLHSSQLKKMTTSVSIVRNHTTTATSPSSSSKQIRDNRMAGRKRFYNIVDINPSSAPWVSFMGEEVDSPISAGVDGTQSASNISLEKPSKVFMKEYLNPIRMNKSGMDCNHDVPWYGITLDGRAIKTPMGTSLSVPSLPLALAIASEWDDQRSYLKPAQMPIMTQVCTAIDQLSIPAVRERTISELMRYLRNDTTCYYADAIEDRMLYKRQTKAWEGIHAWAECQINGIGGTLAIAEGAGEGLIMSRARESKAAGLPHSDEMLYNAEQLLQECNSWSLAAMQAVTTEAKSFLVGSACLHAALDCSTTPSSTASTSTDGTLNPFKKETKKAVKASRVEEEFQIETWGLVEGGHDYDRLNCSIQIHAAMTVLQCIKAIEGRSTVTNVNRL
jgi:ATP synthase mitochondrial F1 complex assembly factor 2